MKIPNDFIKSYSLVTQGILNIIVLAGIGFLIGYFIDKQGILSGILAFIGLIIGLVLFVITTLRLDGEKDGRNT